jgi:hypothetical protein
MSTLALGRFFDVTDASDFVGLTNANWTIASEEIFRRVPTYQNGAPNSVTGPPSAGDCNVGDFWRDQNGAEFVCTVAGTPGTWRQTTPATVTADPASGAFPIDYLILNVADAGLKRHAGSLSWEVEVGASATSKIGFHGATPTTQRANANQAAATDLASVITLANELRAALVEKGLIKGEG